MGFGFRVSFVYHVSPSECFTAGACPMHPSLSLTSRRSGKAFKLYPSPWGRLVEWATLGRAVRHRPFHALTDVSFQVGRGRVARA